MGITVVPPSQNQCNCGKVIPLGRKTCGATKCKNNRSRASSRKSNTLTFIGVDGEGVDRPDGSHEYVMLSVGGRTLWRDGRELTLGEILSFLWECYLKDKDAAYVGFFLEYDFIQWEKHLPEHVAWSLLTAAGIAERKSKVQSRANPVPDPVVWDGWELDIMAGRRWKLRPHAHVESKYGSDCRNRTCEYSFGVSPGGVWVREGETEFVIPDHAGVAWDGTKTEWSALFVSAPTARESRREGWLYVCDTGSFWQTSFLSVIDPKGWSDGVCTPEEFSLIVSGKADRGRVYGRGDTSYFDEMRMYNVLENEILSRVTQRLNEGFMNDAIPIKIPKADWYGPGRAAQLWMDSLHARIADKGAQAFNRGRMAEQNGSQRANEKGILNADVYMSMPSWFYDAARSSYYGGWFEQFMHGHVGDVWEYDINSAYPYIIASLPCLHTTGSHNGSYVRGEGDEYRNQPAKSYTLVYGTFRGSNLYMGPLPHRTKQGLILRPLETEGWYWLHEVEAAKRTGLVESYTVTEWVSYTPCTCTPPFNPTDIGIERMYKLRLEVGKNSPTGKAFKLVYNSAYGKTAQSIGQPKYSNPVYASLITAGCRTLILDAIATHPEGASSVSMVATDGVYFTSRHPSLPLDAQSLGAWDETFMEGMTQLMPGVYWTTALREGIKAKVKSRGISARDLVNEIDFLNHAFAVQQDKLANGGDFEWPSIRLPIRFLLDSAKLALQRGKWDTAGRVQHDTYRTVSSNPSTKRNPNPYVGDDFRCRTKPYARSIDLRSSPYSKTFGFDSDSDLTVGRDGDDGIGYVRELLQH